jgi:hypothetical protein
VSRRGKGMASIAASSEDAVELRGYHRGVRLRCNQRARCCGAGSDRRQRTAPGYGREVFASNGGGLGMPLRDLRPRVRLLGTTFRYNCWTNDISPEKAELPLVVKPNPRQMRAFLSSPAERGLERGRKPVALPVLRRLLIALAIVGVILLSLVLLAALGA